ncbi:glycine--tRNA ligase subunit beta [Deltaproteobacteria bacterium Smac51]|nr:glycine--tRNA ligase subunit beta [Deltaproteobacteria bacterium Smac51]
MGGQSVSNTVDLILELGVEEIPASYFGPAITYLEERLTKTLTDARLPFETLKVWGAPRRLGLGLWGLTAHQPDVEEEITGPPLSAAYDANGTPTRAATGFAGGQGVSVSDLLTVTTPKGQYLAVRKSVKGRAVEEVLCEILPDILQSLPFPKSMRWGNGEYQFVRPVHWLLAVLGGEVLPISFCGAKAGKVSYGHRFLHPGAVVITSPDEYENRLSEVHVHVDFDKRRELVRQEIERVTQENSADLQLVSDEELVEEVANLLEEPVAVLGNFDSHYLELPLAVATTAMKEHQRYFALTDSRGRLAPYFIAVNNTRARDMKVVQRGHERVLRARLEDARFYFMEDRRVKLAEREDELKGVVFHHLMGTSWQKVQRIKALALYLGEILAPELKDTIGRAADLAKCDLVTGVVKEFPTLQGIMGREYALADGEAPEVAEAIMEHYMPLRAGSDLPASKTGAILSVADKLDTIAGCFAVGLIPTGAADPFALRRGALGIINIFIDRGWQMSLTPLIDRALQSLEEWAKRPAKESKTAILEFFKVRLKNMMTGRGVSGDGAEAVLSIYADQPLAAMQRALALEELKAKDGFKDLAQVFKRVVNIIKKFGAKDDFTHWERLSQPAEKVLLERVEELENKTRTYLSAADFSGLMTQIASLREPVDKFFEDTLVDDPDPEIKAARIALLTRVGRIFEQIADFSRISTI